MARLLYALCCMRPLVDSTTNNISAIDILEEITMTKPQTIFGLPLSIVTLWKREEKTEVNEYFKYRIKFVDPSGQEQKMFEANDNVIPQEISRLRSMYTIGGIPFKDDGPYNIVIELESSSQWAEVATLEIDVKHIEDKV